MTVSGHDEAQVHRCASLFYGPEEVTHAIIGHVKIRFINHVRD